MLEVTGKDHDEQNNHGQDGKAKDYIYWLGIHYVEVTTVRW